MLLKYFLATVLFFCTTLLMVAQGRLVKVELKDSVFRNNDHYPKAIDFIFNTKRNYNNFKGIGETTGNFRVKEYPLSKIFYGVKDTGKLFILVSGTASKFSIRPDLNFDRDFSNDRDLTKQELLSGVVLSYEANDKLYHRKVMLYPFPKNQKFGSPDDQKWQMTMSSWPLHKYGVLMDGMSSKSVLFANISLHNLWQKGQTIIFNEDYDPVNNNQIFTSTDSIYFSKAVYVLDSISPQGQAAYFNMTSRNGKCGTEVGDSVCLDQALYTIEKTLIPIPDRVSTKPVIFHFWGSWCGPCLKEMNDLEKVIAKYSPFARFVNIAYENDKRGWATALGLLKKYPLLKENFIEISGNTLLTNRFNIGSFPSYVIIQPGGFIVKKFTGENSLQQLTLFLTGYK